MWIYFFNFAKDNRLLSSDARNANRRRCKNVVGVIYNVPSSPMIANFARGGNNGLMQARQAFAHVYVRRRACLAACVYLDRGKRSQRHECGQSAREASSSLRFFRLRGQWLIRRHRERACKNGRTHARTHARGIAIRNRA